MNTIRDSETVYIVDDDPAVRDALSLLVRSVDLQVQAFADAEQFLPACPNNTQVACLITDIWLPGMDGMALQQALLDRDSALPLIIISAHGDIPMAVEMVRKGALDFIEKPFRNHLILQRIREALQQSRSHHQAIAEQEKLQDRLHSLTPREQQVLELLVQGAPNKRVAQLLDLSPRTVETHRANVLRKMAVRSVTELAHEVTRLRHH